MSEPDASVVASERQLPSQQFRAPLDRLLQGGGSVDGEEFALRLRQFSSLDVESFNEWVLVGADGKTKILFGLLHQVLGLDHLKAARSNFGFGAVDIQGRQSPEFESAFVVLVGRLGSVLGFAGHIEAI